MINFALPGIRSIEFIYHVVCKKINVKTLITTENAVPVFITHIEYFKQNTLHVSVEER